MKRLLLLLLALSLVLAGCSRDAAADTHEFEDLSLQIPADYINLSAEEYAESLTFLFGKDPIAINGLREEKSTFKAYGLDLTLEEYGTFLLHANNVSSELTEKDGICMFTYESGEFTYVVTLWETEEAFWTVQGYCPASQYQKVKNDMWKILSSVKI